LQRPIWIFGGLAGVLCALLEFLFYSREPSSFQQSQFQVLYLIKIGILLICIIFGLVLIRKLRGGIISIGRTLMSGILISLVRSVIMIVAFLILYAPDGKFYEDHKDYALSLMEKKINEDKEIPAEEKLENIADAKATIINNFVPQGYSLYTLGASLITGLIFSVLMAAFISRNMMFEPNE
jgi:hypothetical protein